MSDTDGTMSRRGRPRTRTPEDLRNAAAQTFVNAEYTTSPDRVLPAVKHVHDHLHADNALDREKWNRDRMLREMLIALAVGPFLTRTNGEATAAAATIVHPDRSEVHDKLQEVFAAAMRRLRRGRPPRGGLRGRMLLWAAGPKLPVATEIRATLRAVHAADLARITADYARLFGNRLTGEDVEVFAAVVSAVFDGMLIHAEIGDRSDDAVWATRFADLVIAQIDAVCSGLLRS